VLSARLGPSRARFRRSPSAIIDQQILWRTYKHGCGDTCGRTARRCPQKIGGAELVEIKSRAGERVLPIPPFLAEKLRTHCKEQDQTKVCFGDKYVDRGLVFAHEDGRPIRPEYDRSCWFALLKRAGVDRYVPHEIRHTSGTLLRAAGVPDFEITRFLGHSTTQMLSVYTHPTEAGRVEIARRMEDLLRLPPPEQLL
jgi:integrase